VADDQERIIDIMEIGVQPPFKFRSAVSGGSKGRGGAHADRVGVGRFNSKGAKVHAAVLRCLSTSARKAILRF
jgi:hypothetical protein